jgi:hypothetical protein
LCYYPKYSNFNVGAFSHDSGSFEIFKSDETVSGTGVTFEADASIFELMQTIRLLYSGLIPAPHIAIFGVPLVLDEASAISHLSDPGALRCLKRRFAHDADSFCFLPIGIK